MVVELQPDVDYSEMLNADALDVDDMLKQLRETGLCAVEGIIKEPFRQKLCGEADAHFSTVPQAEIEVSVPTASVLSPSRHHRCMLKCISDLRGGKAFYGLAASRYGFQGGLREKRMSARRYRFVSAPCRSYQLSRCYAIDVCF